MTPISVGAAIRESFRFIRTGWRRAWGIMLILVWLAAMIQAIQLARPEWAAVSLLGLMALVFVTTAATGALYRIGLEPDHTGDPVFREGPAGLQWRALEWRVLLANIVVGLLIGFATLAVIIVWAIVFGVTAAGRAGDLQAMEGASGSEAQMQAFLNLMAGPAGVVSVIILIPALIALAVLAAKVSLFAVTAADVGRFDFRTAWRLTRGALLALIVTAVLIFIAQFALGALAGLVAGLFAAVSGEGVHGGRLWGGVAGQAAGAAINAPLVAGLQLYVYRKQRGDVAVAATFA